MSEAYEAGTRPLRVEWVPETTKGEWPSDPSWNLFSDDMQSVWGWEPDANTTRIDAVGSIKPQGYRNGAESHESSFSYLMQQWFTDSSGDTLDPSNDFIQVNDDNSVKATHTVVSRAEHSTGGTDDAGRRIYVVGVGGTPGSCTVPFETEDGTEIEIELNYQFEKIRPYSISQPSAGTTLEVENTGTTSVDVTIEDEGAATSETLTVAGGSTGTTTSTFDDIDAVELSNEVDGDVTVGDGSGTTFTTIKGSDSYPASEGDLGIPSLGSGSHASAIGVDTGIRFLGDDLQYSSGAIAAEITSGEMSVDLGLDDNTQTGTARRNIHAAEWAATVSASLAGPIQRLSKCRTT